MSETVVSDPLIRLHACPPGGRTLTVADVLESAALKTLALDDDGGGATMLDRLVTPPARVFRLLLDRYGLVFADAGAPEFGVDEDNRPDGRIVVELLVDEAMSTTPASSAAATAYAALVRTARDLGDAFATLTGTDPGTIRARVDRAVAAEFRYLGPSAWTALAGVAHDPGLPPPHRVAPAQHELLTAVIAQVAAATTGRRADPARPRPAVVIVAPAAEPPPPGLPDFRWQVHDAGGVLLTAPHAAGHDTTAEHEVIAVLTLDGDPLTTLETIPATGRTLAAPDRDTLSHTRSLAELRIAELIDTSARAVPHAAHLTDLESRALVAALLADADRAADRLAEAASRAAGTGDPLAAVHRVLTRPRFRKGPNANFPLSRVDATLRPFVARGAPLPVVTFGFPVKLHYNGLKTEGPRPDLAELGALVRLREVQHAVRRVYPPGLDLTVLTDGDHFQPRPAAQLAAYRAKLGEYHALIGGAETLTIADAEDVAEQRLGAGIRERRDELIAVRIRELAGLLGRLEPVPAAFAAVDEADRRCAGVLGSRGDGTVMPGFADLFWSLVYVVPVTPPAGMSLRGRSLQIFADLTDLTDLTDLAPSDALRRARAEVLHAAWHRTIRYLATLQVDRDLGYDDARLFPGRVRLTPHPRPGSLGFSYLGGTGVLPWHGTGAIDPQGHVSADFAIALSDRGYLPVYSPLLGADQPWFLAPGTAVTDGRLDPGFRDGVRLRRR